MNRFTITNAMLVAVVGVLLSGCSGMGAGGAGYDKWAEKTNGKIADWYTSMMNGKKTVKIEDSKAAKDMTLDIHYRIPVDDSKFAKYTPPKVTGEVSYKYSCNWLAFKVDLKNGDGSVIDTLRISFSNTRSDVKNLFDEDVHRESGRGYSDKVTDMFVHDVECRGKRS